MKASTIYSGALALAGLTAIFTMQSAGTALESDAIALVGGIAIFASPVLSLGAAIPGAVQTLGKARSKLSRAFSAAAIGTGLIGAALPFMLTGGEGFAAFAIAPYLLTAAAALNLASDHKANDDQLEDKAMALNDDEPDPPAPFK